MGQTLKILGQQAPGATTETDLYTVPASTATVVSSIIVCNRNASATTFRISISSGGGVTANQDYIYYDTAIPGNDTFTATLGISLAATDKIRVYAGNANVSFSVYGAENS